MSLEFDPIEIAKEYQWEIEVINDPTEAAIRGGDALSTLRQIKTDIFAQDCPIIVRAYGAYVLKHWLEDESRHISLRFDEFTASGRSAGVSFIQNMGNPKLQTLFLAVKGASIIETRPHHDDPVPSVLVSPTLVVPVLEIDVVELAAA